MADTVFLTGASGFIAKHIIVDLLNAGYQVRGSVRSLKRSNEVLDAVRPHISNQDELENNLTFVALDLGKDEGWQGVMDGCSALLHTASPFPLQQPKSDEEIIRPAVDGTVRALRAAHSAGIERVVLTSSAVAVMYKDGPDNGVAFNEEDWSQDQHPTQNAYGRSKTHAEKAAWAFVKDQAPSLKLTTINPVLVLGPALDKNYGTSLQVVERIFAGKEPMQPNFGLPVVDVRDVAAMHVKALSTPGSQGKRVLAADAFMGMVDMARAMQQVYPERGIKAKVAPDFMIKLMGLVNGEAKSLVPQLGVQQRVDTSRAKALFDMEFIPAKDSVLASAASIKKFAD